MGFKPRFAPRVLESTPFVHQKPVVVEAEAFEDEVGSSAPKLSREEAVENPHVAVTLALTVKELDPDAQAVPPAATISSAINTVIPFLMMISFDVPCR